MHEVMLTRADVQGIENSEWIFHACNCVLLHHECHMAFIGHGGKDTYTILVIHLIEHETHQAIMSWFNSLPDLNIVKDAKKRYLSVYEEYYAKRNNS